jgi:hypothetical protein
MTTADFFQHMVVSEILFEVVFITARPFMEDMCGLPDYTATNTTISYHWPSCRLQHLVALVCVIAPCLALSAGIWRRT